MCHRCEYSAVVLGVEMCYRVADDGVVVFFKETATTEIYTE